MAGEEYVSKEVFNLNREQVQKALDTDEKRLNSHSDDIKEITKAVTEIVATNKLLVDTQNLLIKNMEAQENRAPPICIKWYTTDIGKWVIKAGIVTLIIVLCAAIGINALDALKALKTITP